ncbi:protein qua-1-like [Prinia subflava]|uniref:protein qua-1-like n=1 Tax=Prinia subflava TaxID=208062 RepID=UPI002FE248AB
MGTGNGNWERGKRTGAGNGEREREPGTGTGNGNGKRGSPGSGKRAPKGTGAGRKRESGGKRELGTEREIAGAGGHSGMWEERGAEEGPEERETNGTGGGSGEPGRAWGSWEPGTVGQRGAGHGTGIHREREPGDGKPGAGEDSGAPSGGSRPALPTGDTHGARAGGHCLPRHLGAKEVDLCTSSYHFSLDLPVSTAAGEDLEYLWLMLYNKGNRRGRGFTIPGHLNCGIAFLEEILSDCKSCGTAGAAQEAAPPRSCQTRLCQSPQREH